MQFGEYLFKLGGHYTGKLEEEGLLVAEIGIIIAYCPSKDAADHIAGTAVGRKLSIRNGKCDGTDMIGQNTKGYCFTAVTGIIFFLVMDSIFSSVPWNTSVS